MDAWVASGVVVLCEGKPKQQPEAANKESRSIINGIPYTAIALAPGFLHDLDRSGNGAVTLVPALLGSIVATGACVISEW